MVDREKLDRVSQAEMDPHLLQQVDTTRRIATTNLRLAKLFLFFAFLMVLVAANVVISAVRVGGQPNFVGYIFVLVSVVAVVTSWRGYRAARQAAKRVREPAA